MLKYYRLVQYHNRYKKMTEWENMWFGKHDSNAVWNEMVLRGCLIFVILFPVLPHTPTSGYSVYRRCVGCDEKYYLNFLSQRN